MGQLACLESLRLNDNRLALLPAALARLTRLAALSVIDNRLRRIHPALAALTRLAYLDVNNNPDLLCPPPEASPPPLPRPPGARSVRVGLSVDQVLGRLSRAVTSPWACRALAGARFVRVRLCPAAFGVPCSCRRGCARPAVSGCLWRAVLSTCLSPQRRRSLGGAAAAQRRVRRRSARPSQLPCPVYMPAPPSSRVPCLSLLLMPVVDFDGPRTGPPTPP